MRPDPERVLLDLIAHLYEASLDPGLWERFVQHLARAFDAGSAVLTLDGVDGVILTGSTPIAATANWSDAATRAYDDYYFAHDLWGRRIVESGLRRAVMGDELVTPGEMRASVIANEFFPQICGQPHHFGIVTAIIPFNGERAVGVGVHHLDPRRHMERADQDKLNVLLPHLTRAMRIADAMGALAGTAAGLAERLAELDCAAFLVAAGGSVRLMNRQAEALLARGAGVAVRQGKLSAANSPLDAQTDARLARLIHDAARVGAGQSLRPGGGVLRLAGDGPALELRVDPLRHRDAPRHPAAPLVMVTVCEATPASTSAADRMARHHGLSKSEHLLLRGLLDGLALKEYAEQRHITYETARSHLYSVFAKTGCKRQAELVAKSLDARP